MRLIAPPPQGVDSDKIGIGAIDLANGIHRADYNTTILLPTEFIAHRSRSKVKLAERRF